MELMKNASLLAELVAIVRQAGRIPPHVIVTDESRFVDDLAIDSLDLVSVLLKVQDHFDVAIDDDDVPNLRSVADLAAYVEDRRGSAAA
jgi:acyl carrier protein